MPLRHVAKRRRRARKLQIEIVVNINRLPTSTLEKKTLEDIFRFENLIGT